MSDCCSHKTVKSEIAEVVGECPHTASSATNETCQSSGASTLTASTTGCCPSEESPRFDWLLWGSGVPVALAYLTHWLGWHHALPEWLQMMSHGVFELLNTMWWGVLLAALFVGLLSRIPQAMVTAVLGQGGSFGGVLRATFAGTLMDLCSHGILMVGMQLYQRGASLGQVMAFLIASPWNSLSLTIILVALIGLPWTLAFILLSMIIAVISGWIFDRLVQVGRLPNNPNRQDLPENYQLWPELKRFLSSADMGPANSARVVWEGFKGSRMVLRWLLFGILLATALRSFVSLEDFQTWFGPTAMGLVVTLVAATIIEVCSEGSTPIAADLMTRAQAPGNSFAFMMTGVSTDYTEVMVLKDTTRSWKIALFLPLVTVPQVVVVALILNQLPV